MTVNKIDLARQALNAAESSIKLARQLLTEVEQGKDANKTSANELPGITGIFDGENMIGDDGTKYPVPANYASKSMLVVGDTLKLVDEGGEKRFKQVDHVKRHKSVGILTKKDGKFKVVTSEGSYKVLPVTVAYFNGQVGDEATIQIPANNLTAAYAAIESIINKVKPKEEVTKKEAETPKEIKVAKKEEKPVEKVSEVVKPEVPQKSAPVLVEAPVVQKAPSEEVVEIKMPQVEEDELR
ncbi:MAG: hypothetical protein M1150_02415 [Patescibacteria group bacterium]|nr:hypothetical protein [Patescibacteria group bacterium]